MPQRITVQERNADDSTTGKGRSEIRPGYLRKEQAAEYLNISIRTLSDWMRRRIVPFSKISHRICLFRITDLDRAMDRFRVRAVGERDRA